MLLFSNIYTALKLKCTVLNKNIKIKKCASQKQTKIMTFRIKTDYIFSIGNSTHLDRERSKSQLPLKVYGIVVNCSIGGIGNDCSIGKGPPPKSMPPVSHR